jgi:tetratricopeptide (TPR) repeat protein
VTTPAPTTSGTPSLPALEEERDFLLRSLEDLDREWADGNLVAADYRALKDDYTARAASVLRAIEDARTGEGEPPPRRRAEVEHRRPRSRTRRVAALLAAVVLVVVAGTLVARSSDERLPGEPATGRITPTGAPSDVAAQLARARQLIGERQLLEAIKVYDGVLARHPTQPEALAYRGWLVRLAGRQGANVELVNKGLEYLDRAVAADPSYPDAHLFRGLVLYQDKGDPAGAVPELRAFLASNPPPEMRGLVEATLRRAEVDAAAGRPGRPPG